MQGLWRVARAVREAELLDLPGRRRRSTIPTIKVDRDAFGKFAEAFARFMGTARFLFGMTVVMSPSTSPSEAPRSRCRR